MMKPITRGYVISVGRVNFWARLYIRKEIYDAEIRIDKLSVTERRFLQKGAYLAILKSGTIRFSRLRWKKRDIERARKRAARLLRVFQNPHLTDEGDTD